MIKRYGIVWAFAMVLASGVFAALELPNASLDEDYVRARRYPTRPDQPFNETDIEPDNFLTDLFRPGVEYHFTFIKTGHDLFFEVKNEAVRKLFHWPLQGVVPVTEGRVGIRHMFTRCSRYRNIIISTLTE